MKKTVCIVTPLEAHMLPTIEYVESLETRVVQLESAFVKLFDLCDHNIENFDRGSQSYIPNDLYKECYYLRNSMNKKTSEQS